MHKEKPRPEPGLKWTSEELEPAPLPPGRSHAFLHKPAILLAADRCAGRAVFTFECLGGGAAGGTSRPTYLLKKSITTSSEKASENAADVLSLPADVPPCPVDTAEGALDRFLRSAGLVVC